MLDQTWKWRKARKVFVCSMGDLFHEDVPDEWIYKVFARMWTTDDIHTFIVLTKRPQRMAEIISDIKSSQYFSRAWPDKKVWLGVTAENQRTADERIPILMDIPAAVRFVSIEPMLGPVDLTNVRVNDHLSGYMIGENSYSGGLDWVICGGETGTKARPMQISWATKLRHQCIEAGVPFFFKKWGDAYKGEDWDMPREWPKVAGVVA